MGYSVFKRETRHGMTFRARDHMAKYDNASEMIRSRRSCIVLCFLLHRSHVHPKSTVPSLPVIRMAVRFLFSLLTFSFFIDPKTAHHSLLQPPSSTASRSRSIPASPVTTTDGLWASVFDHHKQWNRTSSRQCWIS